MRLETHVTHLGEQIRLKVEWTQKGCIAQCGRPGVRQRKRANQPRVTDTIEQGDLEVNK